ncbi:MAG: OmpA family protein [Clostridiales bacterium]|nr:OmpA family protein [Clostridiales bacterium]
MIYVVGTLSLICVCLLLVSEIFVPPLPYPKCSIGYFNYEREQEYVVADERQATQIINGQYTNGDSRNEELEALAETFTLASTHGIEVINEGDRLRLRLSAENMFKRSRADIEDERKPALDYISETLKAKGARYVRVEGYVNDEPVFTPQYPNTWYLSSARAVSVAIYLQEKTGLRHTDIAAEGKGPFFPIYEAGSVKNSLIEIIITP